MLIVFIVDTLSCYVQVTKVRGDGKMLHSESRLDE